MSETETAQLRRHRWRTVDIVVASVIGVVFGVVFAVWNNLLYSVINAPLGALPIAPLASGVWLIPAVLGALVVRRPGAALYTEVLAATVSMFFGSAWGLSVFLSGVWQGLGAEVVLALLVYRRWGLGAAVLAGGGAGLAMGLYEIVTYVPTYSWDWKVVYTGCAVVAGVAAGVLAWLLVRALARTGALAPFAAGRAQNEI
ncbi:ECF transporter S component [Jiangella alkaliphila]|uniref:Energy-coupling factor transport system substrate-specific component n=1 Tax=Jiangella alkaliphila TaxID=419479 RepID=A0A1H2JEL5_9ACTN|nr:ECF transporter S component [Jiangella alkaliphila]SDU54852.1 energy-coupling factor transport system substrate-specific component [Jiangella alkaliphila]